MLGSLTRWLRILGFDTQYATDSTDDEVLAQTVAEGRTLLTVDEELWRTATKRGVHSVLVRGDTLAEKLASTLRGRIRVLNVNPDRSRCALCNTTLTRIDRRSTRERVPPTVYRRHRLFWQCATCRRIYWLGTHVDRMKRVASETRRVFRS